MKSLTVSGSQFFATIVFNAEASRVELIVGLESGSMPVVETSCPAEFYSIGEMFQSSLVTRYFNNIELTREVVHDIGMIFLFIQRWRHELWKAGLIDRIEILTEEGE